MGKENKEEEEKKKKEREAATTTSATNATSNVSHEELAHWVSEKEKLLTSVSDEYDAQYEQFFTVTKSYHSQRLTNLKLTFKNQILKQKIYFEQELSELGKECSRDYEQNVSS